MNKKHNEKSHKTSWIESLKKQNLKPIMKILDEVDEKEWKYWERFWIQQFIVWGFNLVNHTSGGDGLSFGNQTSFKKGQKSIRLGTGYKYICQICDKEFSDTPSSKRKVCSVTCQNVLSSKKPNKGAFNDNHIPWNKGKKILRKAMPVLQFDLNDEFIEEFKGCKEASKAMNCIAENIRRACVGKSKTAMNFKWKYKNDYEKNK